VFFQHFQKFLAGLVFDYFYWVMSLDGLDSRLVFALKTLITFFMKHLVKPLQASVALAILFLIQSNAGAQSLLGTWQLVKQTSCLEGEMTTDEDSAEDLLETMKGMSGPAQQIVQFKEKSAGEESTRILNRKRSANDRKFYYKFNGESLLILDKKSQTITDAYTVDRLDADSLILSNASRACETRVFLKIKDPKKN
jgi:hypothetical protein